MTPHPYKSLPHSAFWRRSVADAAIEAVDPVGQAKFVLSKTDRIATAGSCFAQHIARHLSQSGFNYLVTETAHPLVSMPLAKQFGYGLFTARYANIYNSRQMLQLLMRAYHLFQPSDDIWFEEGGRIIDPFRPEIQAGGFSSLEEFRADRDQHFSAIRKAVETLDCLVFTMGLTECWMSKDDGAVYPICPGVSGGRFDPERHMFHNLGFNEVFSDLRSIQSFIVLRNPSARIILTVSPVPLVATASSQHVLSATTFSKSILRAAAGEFSSRHGTVAYFPSYEIITGSYTRGSYFAPDLRSVTEAGVSHVMRLFLEHYGSVNNSGGDPQSVQPYPHSYKSTNDLVRVVCEEEALQKFDV